MIDHALQVALCRSATARAHLAGAEAAELEAQIRQYGMTDSLDQWESLCRRLDAARRRYWREQHHAALLQGWRWPEAEALGREA